MNALDELLGSPEFLIRRAHQISTAAFAAACKDLDLTPSQYAALFVLRQKADVHQNELGRTIALDKSTMSVVLRSLRERALVVAYPDASDRRKTRLDLTDAGRLLLGQAERRSSRSTQALMDVLGREKSELLIALLREFADAAERGVEA